MQEKILTYWKSLEQREQRGVMVVSVLVVIMLFYYALVNPIVSRAAKAELALENEMKLAAWVEEKVSIIKANQGGSSGQQVSNMPVNQAITSTVNSYNIKIVRLQPQKDDLQVWLQPVAFNNLLRWLDLLEKRYAIVVKSIDLAKADVEGAVEIKRLELGRG